MPAAAKEFKALSKLFDALGFERGTPWKTARGQGAPFKAPLGQIEFVEGLETVHADIWVEVTDLDSMREVLAKEKFKIATEMQQTAWDSRFLVAEPAKGLKVLFWQKNRPDAGRDGRRLERARNALCRGGEPLEFVHHRTPAARRAGRAAPQRLLAKRTSRWCECRARLKFLPRRARWRRAASMTPSLRWAA